MMQRPPARAIAAILAAGLTGSVLVGLSQPNRDTGRQPDRKPPAQSPSVKPGSKGVQVGQVAPEWKGKDAAGKEHKLSDYRGKVVLMDFWGTWCPPCVGSMPGLQKLHESYGQDGLVILGMNVERRSDADPAGFMKKNGYTYGLILNSEPIANQYQVRGYPTFILIDPAGTIVVREVGGGDAVKKKLEDAIKANLEKVRKDEPKKPDRSKPDKPKPETDKPEEDKKETPPPAPGSGAQPPGKPGGG